MQDVSERGSIENTDLGVLVFDSLARNSVTRSGVDKKVWNRVTGSDGSDDKLFYLYHFINLSTFII